MKVSVDKRLKLYVGYGFQILPDKIVWLCEIKGKEIEMLVKVC